jgi:hypothetical protein
MTSRVPAPDHELTIGQLRRQVLLGTEAVYRVCGLGEELVEVEVVSAPGLPSGRRFNLMREAIEQMDLVGDRI